MANFGGAQTSLPLFVVLLVTVTVSVNAQDSLPRIGREVAVPVHLQDGDEFNIPIAQLIDYGRQLFTAKFTVQEGAGRPMTKGTGAAISNPGSPLRDRVTEVFVLAQRLDHLTLDAPSVNQD
jgi:hypothetical protein